MFSIDFESPRFKSAMRTLQFVLLSVFVVVGTIILVYAGQGYDINRRTGEVIQNGLLLVNSTPEGAVVSINGQAENDTTPGRFPLPEGTYDISIAADGYRTWQKSLTVAGSAVEWVYYPLLIPNELEPSTISARQNVEFIGQSPDGQRFLIRQTARTASFNLMNISGKSVNDDDVITLPAELLQLSAANGRLGQFDFEGWADDNISVLLSHRVNNKVEYILLDTQEPADSINLTDEYDLDLRDVRLINGQAGEFYALVNEDLRRLNLDQGTISTPLARNVRRYVLHEDRFVAYINSDSNDQLQLGLIDNSQATVLQELEGEAKRYGLEFAAFDGEFHLALLDRQLERLTVLIDPHVQSQDADSLSRFIMPTPKAQYVSFSRNGQFVLAQGGGSFYTHDFDRTRRFKFNPDINLPADYQARWLNGNYLVAHDRAGLMHLFEFDGGNLQSLYPSDPDFEVWVGNNQETLYSLLPGNGTLTFLQATSLISETD